MVYILVYSITSLFASVHTPDMPTCLSMVELPCLYANLHFLPLLLYLSQPFRGFPHCIEKCIRSHHLMTDIHDN